MKEYYRCRPVWGPNYENFACARMYVCVCVWIFLVSDVCNEYMNILKIRIESMLILPVSVKLFQLICSEETDILYSDMTHETVKADTQGALVH